MFIDQQYLLQENSRWMKNMLHDGWDSDFLQFYFIGFKFNIP